MHDMPDFEKDASPMKCTSEPEISGFQESLLLPRTCFTSHISHNKYLYIFLLTHRKLDMPIGFIRRRCGSGGGGRPNAVRLRGNIRAPLLTRARGTGPRRQGQRQATPRALI